MKIFQVPPNSSHANDFCAQCERKIRSEDWIVSHRLLDATSFVRFTAHVDCLRNAMADAPDVSGTNFEQAGEELLALRETL